MNIKLAKITLFLVFAVLGIIFSGCSFKEPFPTSKVVNDFKPTKFLGKWYEIVRMPNSAEKNLKNVEIFYVNNHDGSIGIFTRGSDKKTNFEIKSKGKLQFDYNEQIGAMKAKYGYFKHSAYSLVKIDDNYQYAMIFGDNTSSMWLISRKKTMPEVIKAVYLGYAKSCGYDIKQLIWTIQE